MIKKARAGKKYYFILFALTIIAFGAIIYFNKRYVIDAPAGGSMVPTVSETGAAIIFDVYEAKGGDSDNRWQDTITVPRVIYGADPLSAKLFSEYAFQKIIGEDRLGYKIVEQNASLEKAIKLANDLAEISDGEKIDLSGVSQTTVSEYLFKGAVFSGRFDRYAVGGAHPTSLLITINYDLLGRQEIKLGDILLINDEKLIDYLKDLINSPIPVYSDYADCLPEELAPSGYYLTENKLKIILSPSNLSSYCPPLIALDYEAIQGIINSEGPLKRIIN
jgi:hypothetical protein